MRMVSAAGMPSTLSAVIPVKFSDSALALSENASRDPVTPVARRSTVELNPRAVHPFFQHAQRAVDNAHVVPDMRALAVALRVVPRQVDNNALALVRDLERPRLYHFFRLLLVCHQNDPVDSRILSGNLFDNRVALSCAVCVIQALHLLEI
jgi:hypothetical protein